MDTFDKPSEIGTTSTVTTAGFMFIKPEPITAARVGTPADVFASTNRVPCSLNTLRAVCSTACGSALISTVNSKPINHLSAHPDGVILSYFEVETLPGLPEVYIEWETAIEPEVAGFYVGRSLTATASYTRVSAFFLALGDAVTGAQYDFLDDTTEFGQTYYYRLEVVNNDQTLEYYGPISVTAGIPAGSLIQRAYLPLIAHAD